MKRSAIGILSLVLLCGSTAVFAAEGYDAMRAAHREQVKQMKKMKRESAPATPSAPSKTAEFWAKEGERSGLGDAGSRTGSFLRKLNPVPFLQRQKENYDARKASAGSAVK